MSSEQKIIDRLTQIESAIQRGGERLLELTHTVHKLQKGIEVMSLESDVLNTQVAALVSEVQAAVTKLGDVAGDKKALADAASQLKTVTDQLHAATNPV